MKKTNISILIFLILLISSCDSGYSVNRELLKSQEEMISQNYTSVQARYVKILGMNPASSVQEKVYLQLADLNYLYLGDFNSAIKYYLKVLEISSTINWKIQAYEKIGEIYFNVLKDYQKAKEVYIILDSFVPKLQNSDFYEFQLSRCFFELQDIEKSFHFLEKISIDKNHIFNIQAQYYLGLLHFHLGAYQKAIQHWRYYLEKSPYGEKSIQTKIEMAVAFEEIKKNQESLEIYRSIVSEFSRPEIIKQRVKSLMIRKFNSNYKN
jgi:tetratricopeptide (TPR) repeat protein